MVARLEAPQPAAIRVYRMMKAPDSGGAPGASKDQGERVGHLHPNLVTDGLQPVGERLRADRPLGVAHVDHTVVHLDVIGLDHGVARGPQQPGMHEVQMGQVQRVLREPSRSRLPYPAELAPGMELGIVQPRVLGHGLQGILQSDPHQPVALLAPVGNRPSPRRDPLGVGRLRRDQHTRPVRVVLPAVVGALQTPVVGHPAQRQARPPMHTQIGEASHRTAGTEQHQALAQQCHRNRRVLHPRRLGHRMPETPQRRQVHTSRHLRHHARPLSWLTSGVPYRTACRPGESPSTTTQCSCNV